MRRGHKRTEIPTSEGLDSDESDIVREQHPALVSVDATIAMSRRVVKESLDLNCGRSGGKYDLPQQDGNGLRLRHYSSTGEGRNEVDGRRKELASPSPNQRTDAASPMLERLRSEEVLKRFYENEIASLRSRLNVSDSLSSELSNLRSELSIAKEALHASQTALKDATTFSSAKDRALTGKLIELENVIRTLNKELKRKNGEINNAELLIRRGEDQESSLKRDMENLQKRAKETIEKIALEKQILEDAETDLKTRLEFAENLLQETREKQEKTVREMRILEEEKEDANRKSEKLASELENVKSTYEETAEKTRLELSEAETANLRLKRQIQDLTDLHSSTIDEIGRLPRLETKYKDLETSHLDQISLNLKLQEEVKTLQLENEALRREKADEMKKAKAEVNEQAAKFAQKIEDLEFQFQKHIKTNQENRLFSSFQDVALASPSPLPSSASKQTRGTKSSSSLKASRRPKS